MESKTIMLGVRVDYTTDGRDEQHPETAARMVIREQYPTIENGVKIETVEVLNHGERLFTIDAEDTVTPYRVTSDGDTIEVWDDGNDVGIQFKKGDPLARYDSVILTKRKTFKHVTELEAVNETVTRLLDYF